MSEGISDKPAGLVGDAELADCPGLHKDIADGGRLDGAGDDDFACGVGGELVEELSFASRRRRCGGGRIDLPVTSSMLSKVSRYLKARHSRMTRTI